MFFSLYLPLKCKFDACIQLPICETIGYYLKNKGFLLGQWQQVNTGSASSQNENTTLVQHTVLYSPKVFGYLAFVRMRLPALSAQIKNTEQIKLFVLW